MSPSRLKIYASLRRYCQDDRGATSVEYGLVTALIVLMTVAAMELTGSGVANILTYMSTTIDNAGS
ncbi:MAG: Flp family type IVb pilin [Rhodospirillales bacterium]|nr:Flp family type IVb pilin [Rhodospirillales bacterium]